MEAIKKTNGLALAGFICSLVGIFMPLLTLLGIIFSAIGLNKINKQSDIYKGKGYATAGLIIGIATVVFLIVYLIVSFSEPNYFN